MPFYNYYCKDLDCKGELGDYERDIMDPEPTCPICKGLMTWKHMRSGRDDNPTKSSGGITRNNTPALSQSLKSKWQERRVAQFKKTGK